MKFFLTPISLMNLFAMLGFSLVLSVDLELFEREGSSVYTFLEFFLPQVGYSFVALVIVLVFLSALLFRKRLLEVAGLALSGVYMLVVLAGYLISFPNIGTVAFAVWTITNFMVIADLMSHAQYTNKYSSKGGEDL